MRSHHEATTNGHKPGPDHHLRSGQQSSVRTWRAAGARWATCSAGLAATLFLLVAPAGAAPGEAEEIALARRVAASQGRYCASPSSCRPRTADPVRGSLSFGVVVIAAGCLARRRTSPAH